MKNNKGFTLIELLATITIVSILSVVGVVAYINYIDYTKNKAYDTISYYKEINNIEYSLDNIRSTEASVLLIYHKE